MTAPPNRPPSEFAERWCTGHGISCDAATVMTEPMKVAVKREDMKERRWLVDSRRIVLLTIESLRSKKARQFQGSYMVIV